MASLDDINNLVRTGNKTAAIAQLAGLLRSDLQNCSLWLLMAELVDDPARKQDCYRRVLALDAGNQEAHAFLDRLQPPRLPAAAALKVEPAVRMEPDTQPRQTLPIPSAPSPTRLASYQTPPAAVQMARPVHTIPPQYQPAPASKKPIKKYKIWWWLCLLFITSIVYSLGLLSFLFFHFLPSTTTNAISDVIFIIGRLATYLIFLFWFIKGVIGGVILANKKLRGGGWVWVLILLPVILFPAYLAFMGLLGEFAYAWGRNASYSRKKCPQCQSWIPREATRCQKCGQVVPVEVN